MPGFDDLKNAVSGAMGAAKDAAEKAVGLDVDGDGAVGAEVGAAEGEGILSGAVDAITGAADAAFDKVESVVGIDIDGDGDVAGGAAPAVEAADAAEAPAVEAADAAVPEAAAPAAVTAATAAAASEVSASARGTFDQNEDLLTPVIEKAGEVAANAVNAAEGLTGVDINGDGTVGGGAAPAAGGEGGILDGIQSAIGGLKDKVEGAVGMDIDGDGAVGAGDAPAGEAAVDVALDAEAAVEEAATAVAADAEAVAEEAASEEL